MFDPHNFQPLTGVSEPTPAMKHREEYANSLQRGKLQTRRPARQAADTTLLRAEFMTTIGRYLHIA